MMPIRNGEIRNPEKRDGRATCVAHLYVTLDGGSGDGVRKGSSCDRGRCHIVYERELSRFRRTEAIWMNFLIEEVEKMRNSYHGRIILTPTSAEGKKQHACKGRNNVGCELRNCNATCECEG